MPLRIVRGDPAPLWAACSDRFLSAGQQRTGRHRSHLWLTHRIQRDRLLTDAFTRGIRGWMPPPFSFLSELPRRFAIEGRPIGLLTRRRMISTIAADAAAEFGIHGAGELGAVRGHMLDAVIGELLPESISPDGLERALHAVAADDFAARRNAWVHAVYVEYQRTLEQEGLYDSRSIHALVAQAIAHGRLASAIGNSDTLHIYGMYSLRTRGAMVAALSAQTDVDVILYVPAVSPEFDGFPSEVLPPDALREPINVQPAPDPQREMQWVAEQVKEILINGHVEPHDIAIVARSGRDDTRRVCERLDAAGVPFSARVRRRMHEVPVIALLLEIFRGGGEGWDYRALRNVVSNAYTRVRIDARSLDVIAGRARPRTLEDWSNAWSQLIADLSDENRDRDLKRMRLAAARVERDAAAFADLRVLEPLLDARTEADWVRTTRAFVRDDALRILQSLCRVPGDRHDVVRFDQRACARLDTLLADWETIAEARSPVTAAEWHRTLRRFLESEELALSTPSQKGVQVLEAHDAAMLPFAHTFVVHVNDGEFPARRAVGGVFSEEEREMLRRAGLPFEDRSLALLREQVLWHAVTSSGTTTATYRTTDPRGTPLLPSMLLPKHDNANELPRSLDILNLPVSLEQARQLAVLSLARTDRARSAQPAMVAQAVIAAHAEQSRGAPERASIEDAGRRSPWNGVIRDPMVLDHIGRRYDDSHAWSATQLQLYARNPFFFLVDRVLYLRALEEAEEETRALEFGAVAHDILERFYRPFAESGAQPRLADLDAHFEDTAAAVIAEREASGQWLGSRLLWNIKRRTIRRVVHDYLAWEIPYIASEGERPWRCELEIGTDADPAVITGADVRGNAVRMRITGRIDRVDVAAGQEYRVLDYKTGSIPATKGYDDGALQQAPLYMEALRQIHGLNAKRGRYRSLKSPDKPKNGAEVVYGNARFTSALKSAFSIPARVRRGMFECEMCFSSEYASWDHGPAITRTRAILEAGNRFDV